MSPVTTPTYSIVVDCSIAQAAGSLETQHPRGIACREFLMKLRGANHRLAWSAAIAAEWNEHQSQFAITWRVSMQRLGNIRSVECEPQFDDHIRASTLEHGVKEALLKDTHLVDAALATDQRLASLDDRARGHFSRLTGDISEIGNVLWVNPVHPEEAASEWLERGAPAEPQRQLNQYRSQ